MAIYRFFLFRDREIAGRVTRECTDDLDALQTARAICGDHGVEVYCGDRLTSRVNRRDEPLSYEMVRS